jgi:hypothetical protein
VTTGPLEALAITGEGFTRPPLEFTRQVMGRFADHVVGAMSAPLPVDDPLASYRYIRGRTQTLVDAMKQPGLVRLQDKNYSQLAPIPQAQSVRFEEIAADTGEAGVVIRGGDYLSQWVRNAVRIEEDLHLSIDPIPTMPDWKTRWGGKITDINVKRDAKGYHTVELIASSNREHLKNILIAATPFFPPEVQPISMWMLPANIRTACTITMAIQLARHFFPLASIPSNLLNPFGWINPFGPDALLGFDPLNWPIQPQFINFFLDQSRTSLLTSAWNNFHDSTKDPLKDAGCTARVYTWFTEDKTSPHPELEKLVGKDVANLARPHRNCLIPAFEDHSGYAGPTGTAADGPINLFASTLDDLITTTVFPVDVDNDGEVDPVFRRLFLVAPPKPDVVFRDGMHSGIVESNYHQIKGPVKTTMTGGKSPRLVNDIQTFAIRWAISQLAQVVLGTEAPGVEGLDNLYQRPRANSIISSLPGNAIRTRSAQSSPATWDTWNTSKSRTLRRGRSRRFSTSGSVTIRSGRTGGSRRPSATRRRGWCTTTSTWMIGSCLRSTASTTSIRRRRSGTGSTGPHRSPTRFRLVMTPATMTRSPKGSGRFRLCIR